MGRSRYSLACILVSGHVTDGGLRIWNYFKVGKSSAVHSFI